MSEMGFFGSYEARRVHEQRTAPLEPKSGLVGPPARVSHNRGTRENVPYAMVESETSAEVLRLALGRCASSRFAQDDSGEV
jgi:hypothetical protein